MKVEKGKIKDVKFLSFGCASNIATASVLTEKVKGMTIAEAKKYPWQKVVAELGGLPNQKVHCSIMAVDGLKKAIADYEKSLTVKPVASKKGAVSKQKPTPKKNLTIKKKTPVKKK